jgi:hypothetical protein
MHGVSDLVPSAGSGVLGIFFDLDAVRLAATRQQLISDQSDDRDSVGERRLPDIQGHRNPAALSFVDCPSAIIRVISSVPNRWVLSVRKRR